MLITSKLCAAPKSWGRAALGTLGLTTLLLTSSQSAHALEYTLGYDPVVHNRFEVGTFAHGAAGDPIPLVPPVENDDAWAAQYDFTGVGWATNRSFRHVAMISPSHYVNAHHAVFSNHKVSFVNDVGEIHTFVTTNPTQIAGDLSVATLTTLEGDPVDVTDYGISYYPLYTADASFYVDRNLLRYGAEGRDAWQNTPDDPNQGPRLATARVTSVSGNNIFMSPSQITVSDQPTTAVPKVGDSGSPIFYVHDGQLTIAATTFTTTAGAFVGSDIATLNDYMANEGHALTVLDDGSANGTAEITSPAHDEEVEGFIDVIGTANDDDMSHFTVDYYTGELEWQEWFSSEKPVVNGQLSPKFDTALMGSGRGILRITVFDRNGGQTSSTRWVWAGVPHADAGPDQVFTYAPKLFQLDGSGSYDPDGTIESYFWWQTGGPTMTIVDPSAAVTNVIGPEWFQEPQPFTVTFNLQVIDNDGVVDMDTVVIDVQTGGNEK